MKKRLAMLFCSAVMVSTLTTGIVMASATGNASPSGQNVTDVSRITSTSEMADVPYVPTGFCKEMTLQKDGTGTGEDSMSFSGLVPYGTGTISLGTFNMTPGLDKPLFTIVPQKSWSSSTTATSAVDDMTFYVDLTSEGKTISYKFSTVTNPDYGTNGQNYSTVAIGTAGNYFVSRYNSLYTDDLTKPATGFPCRFDGTTTDIKVIDETNTSITKPTEIGFYYDTTGWYVDVYSDCSIKESARVETTTGSGIYRYKISGNWGTISIWAETKVYLPRPATTSLKSSGSV